MGATKPTKSARLELDERRVLGAWIKLTSQAMGLKQREIASRCGLDRMTVSRLYTGRVVKRRDYELVCSELGYAFDAALELANQSLDHVIEPLTSGPEEQEPVTQETGMYDQATVITVCAEKGGVGKTTSVVTLATMLASGDQRVLVIDLDPQANATAWLLGEYDEDNGASLLSSLEQGEAMPVLESDYGVDVVPSGRFMARAPMVLSSMTAGHLRLKKILKRHRDDYDYILIDTPPALGIVTICALTASHHTLLPARTDGFSLDAIERTMDTCLEVQEDLNEGLNVLGCVVLEYEQRAIVGREIVRQLEMIEGLDVLEPHIPTCIYFKEATAAREPIDVYRPEHKATRQFRILAKRIDARCRPIKQVIG